jgi:hypothetical protein
MGEAPAPARPGGPPDPPRSRSGRVAALVEPNFTATVALERVQTMAEPWLAERESRSTLLPRLWLAALVIGAGALALSDPAATVVLLRTAHDHLATGSAWLVRAATVSALTLHGREPIVALALIGAVLVPLLALLGRACRRGVAAVPAWAPSSDGTPPDGRRRPGQVAWLADPGLPQRREMGELVRIGATEDCDIVTAEGPPGIGALIQRTHDCEFFILDVGVNDGPRATVNGRPVRRARLSDGDRIEIGGFSATFRQPPRGAIVPREEQ